MHIINVGTFLLPVRFPLVGMMGFGGREKLSEVVRGCLPDFTTNVVEDDGLFFDIRGQRYQHLETMVFSGVTNIEGAGDVRLYISSLAIGFVVVDMQLPDDLVLDLDDEVSCERFKSYETPVTQAVEPQVKRWCEQIVASLDADMTRPLPESALTGGKLLWWHRVCVDAAPEVEFPAPRWYGATAKLAGEAHAEVGIGMSNLRTAGRPSLVDDMVEGLMAATQEWIVVDEAKRHIADHLLTLSRVGTRNLITVDTQYQEVLRLTEDVTLRNLLLRQESRYLTAPRMRVSHAAAQAWETDREAEGLEERIAALRDLFSLHRERIFNNRDDRRNRLVFVFTAVTLIQSVLVWYDFLTTDSNVYGGAPRPAIAITVLLLTVAAVAGAFAFRPRSRRRLMPHRVPRQRAGTDAVLQDVE